MGFNSAPMGGIFFTTLSSSPRLVVGSLFQSERAAKTKDALAAGLVIILFMKPDCQAALLSVIILFIQRTQQPLHRHNMKKESGNLLGTVSIPYQ